MQDGNHADIVGDARCACVVIGVHVPQAPRDHLHASQGVVVAVADHDLADILVAAEVPALRLILDTGRDALRYLTSLRRLVPRTEDNTVSITLFGTQIIAHSIAL